MNPRARSSRSPAVPAAPARGRRSARRIVALAFLLAGVLGSSLLAARPAAADRGGYTITRFDTDLTVQRNADLLVEERLQVQFAEPRHGIYRDIPIHYTDPKGFTYSMGFRLLEVRDENGKLYKTKVTRRGRYVSIRIGSADRTRVGPVTYAIRYRVRHALGAFPDHDEIYWNATGNEWRTRIRSASVTVRLPAPLPSDSLQTEAFTGRFGARGRSVTVSHPEPGVVRFETTAELRPLEGLTVAVAWPKGYVAFPGTLARVGRFLADNWVLLAPVFFFGMLWRRYRSRGRDPEGPVAVMVRYEPPEGISPAELGTVMDESVDLRDITASVVELAVKGYLVIRREETPGFLGLGKKTETVFERRYDADEAALLPHQRRILAGLFASGNVVSTSDLKNKFYTHLPGIRDALYERCVKQGYFVSDPTGVRRTYSLMGIGFGLLAALLGVLWAAARGGIFPNALGVPVTAGVATALVFFAFAPAMPRRTRRGVEMRAWGRGFEEFAQRVEKERLEADRARNVFEALLPFAMALGVADAWARKFEGIYREGGPGWYVGPHPGAVFSTMALQHDLGGAMNQVGQQMAAAPRSQGSSGFGGGGFSGGGGGGGGGGSW